MRGDSKRQFPHPSIRRLPSYLRLLQQLKTEGEQKVSCTTIARELDLDSTQVRKDLALTGITGRPRIGYELAPLIEAIEAFLGWDRVTEAYLVGCGSLGHALIGYENFRRCGLHISGAFDIAPDKLGQDIHGVVVRHIDDMPGLATQNNVKVGILAVPAGAAQAAANLMVESGITGIWNFSPAKLDVPDGIMVENVELASSLAVLSVNMNGR